ncbi:MAG: glycosyltransferase family 39 protein, partial [Anaerolineales bacterium]|nr:glycosyltransferase family 39 protein [Anaerolineales bacterium]
IDNYVLRHLFLSGDSLEILQMVVVGRYMSVLADCITLLMVYFIGRKLSGDLVGFISAGLFAVSVQFIQQAHFGTFDSLLATAVTTALWILVLYVESGKLRHLNFAGGAIGLAVGIKANAVLLVLPAFTAILCHELIREGAKLGSGRRLIQVWIVPILWALGVFVLGNPYALLEWQEYLGNIAIQTYMVRGLVNWPFILQYRDTVPYIYHIIEQGRWTLGWPLTIFMYGGTLVHMTQVGSRLCLRKTDVGVVQQLVLLSWVVSYFVLIGGLHVKYPRYMLPIIPVQIVFATSMLVWFAKKSVAYGVPVLLVVVGTTAVYAMGYVSMYEKPHPWIVASNWIYENGEKGGTILTEKWDHPLPLSQVRQGNILMFRDEYDSVALGLADLPDTKSKLETIVQNVVEADYIVVASNRNYSPVLANPDMFPYSMKYYQSLFDGTLGYTLLLAETRYPNFAGRSLRGDPIKSAGVNLKDIQKYFYTTHRSVVADESFTVYDHPLVLVFHNQSKLEYHRMMEVIVGK